MRKVLYLNQLSDGAVSVSVYTGESGKGSLQEYGVRSSKLIERIRNFAKKHGKGGPSKFPPPSEVYEIVDDS